jgi:hypothetical protein
MALEFKGISFNNAYESSVSEHAILDVTGREGSCDCCSNKGINGGNEASDENDLHIDSRLM